MLVLLLLAVAVVLCLLLAVSVVRIVQGEDVQRLRAFSPPLVSEAVQDDVAQLHRGDRCSLPSAANQAGVAMLPCALLAKPLQDGAAGAHQSGLFLRRELDAVGVAGRQPILALVAYATAH